MGSGFGIYVYNPLGWWLRIFGNDDDGCCDFAFEFFHYTKSCSILLVHFPHKEPSYAQFLDDWPFIFSLEKNRFTTCGGIFLLTNRYIWRLNGCWLISLLMIGKLGKKNTYRSQYGLIKNGRSWNLRYRGCRIWIWGRNFCSGKVSRN